MGVAAAMSHPNVGVVAPGASLVKILRNHHWYYGMANIKNPMLIQSVGNANSIRACKLVRKWLDNDSCENFQNYFELQQPKTETRNVGYLIRIQNRIR